jgi:hypothetical protein
VAVLGASVIVAVRLEGSEVSGYNWSDPQSVRLRLLPLAMTLAMIGILASLAPGRHRDPSRERPQATYGMSVICAGVVAVVFAASQAFVPYLVLLAMDAVRNAMPGPVALHTLRPDLKGRLAGAGLQSAPVLACCFGLGLLTARDCRRPAGATGPVSERGPFALPAVAAATGLGAVWLLAVTLPRLDGWLAEGFHVTIDPLNAALVAFGFAGLAFGIAARANSPPGPPEPARAEARPWTRFWRALGSLAIGLLVLDFVAAHVIELILARRVTDGGPVDESWSRWVGWVDAAFDWLLSVVPWKRVTPWYVYEAPGWIALALTMTWVAWRVVLLLLAPIGTRPTPIDASLADRRSFKRFTIRWVALTVLMIAALPALFLTGLAVLHGVFRLTG